MSQAANRRTLDDWVEELIEVAGARAEEAVVTWQSERRAAGLPLDLYGGAFVHLYFTDRALLNSFKRTGLATKGAYPGQWILEHRWAHVGQEAGVATAMAERVAALLNAAFRARAKAYVHEYLS